MSDDIEKIKAQLTQEMTRRRQLEEDVKICRNHLEELVEARTRELRQANEELQREVIERKRAEDALRESEARLRTLINAMPDFVCFKDGEGRWLEANEAALRIFDLEGTEYRGRKDSELAAYTPLYRKAFLTCEETDEQTWQKGKLLRGEEIIPNHNGDCNTFDVFKVPVFHPDGGRKGLVVLGRDITESCRMQQALQRYTERLQTLHEIDQAILMAHSPKAIARAALRHIRRLIPCRLASIIELDIESRQATVLVAHIDGQTSGGSGNVISLEEIRGTKTLKQGRVYTVEDIQALPRSNSVDVTLQARGIRSYMSVPLLFQEELIGILNLGSDQPALFTAEHIDVAREVAMSLAVAIRQVRLHQQTCRDAETRSMLLQEVNHRVKNNLSMIIGLLYAERRHAGMEKQAMYQEIMDDLISRVQGLATVHSLLSASQWSPLLLCDLVRYVIRSTLRALPSDQTVAVDIAPVSVRVTPEQAHNLALVINELTTNMVKHALAVIDETARLTVRIGREGDTVYLQFRDNGPGYPEEMLQSDIEYHNVGFEIIRNIVQKNLEGDLSLNNDEGAVAMVRFKSKVTQ